MEKTDFASIVPKIKVWETKLLNKSFYDKLIDMGSYEEAIKLLHESSYNDYNLNENYELNLENLYKEVCEDLNKTMKHTDVIKFVCLKNDYNNIKALIKGRILSEDFASILNKNGTVDLKVIKLAFKNDNFRELEPIMVECINESIGSYESYYDPQRVDIIVDKYMFKHMRNIAIDMESKFTLKYMEILIDLTNIKTLLRSKRINKDKYFLKEVLLENGGLPTNLFLDNLSSTFEEIPNKFLRTSYYKLISDSINEYLTSNSLNALEKNIDNYIMKFVKDAKFISFGVEPIFAYLYAREIENKNLRIVLAGKENNVDSSIIKERLRDNYV